MPIIIVLLIPVGIDEAKVEYEGYIVHGTVKYYALDGGVYYYFDEKN